MADDGSPVFSPSRFPFRDKSLLGLFAIPICCYAAKLLGANWLRMRKLGFRVWLPSLNLLLFAMLSVLGKRPLLVASLLQEIPDVPFHPTNTVYPLLSMPRLIAIGLNAPAVVLSQFLLECFGVSVYEAAGWLLVISCPFVVLFWYLTGRWIDRRIGLLPVVAQPKRRLALLTGSAIVIGLVFAACLDRVVYFIHGGIAGWHGETTLNAAQTYGFTAWVALWELMLITARLRCARSGQQTFGIDSESR